jgi:hypothetical protein
VLKRTFIHIEGIGGKTEKRLWDQGILTWDDFLQADNTGPAARRDQVVRRELNASMIHQRDIRFFAGRLPAREMWRLYGDFKDQAVYLDIETSGTHGDEAEITVIGLYDGRRVQTFVNGKNLDAFEIALSSYPLVVTFNGSCFDLPVIRRSFKDISLPPAHIDLRFLLGRLGYRGSLKRIEQEVAGVRGMGGIDAVLLWHAYQWGDDSALERLIRYNTADIVNLKPLMEMAFEQMKARVLLDQDGE